MKKIYFFLPTFVFSIFATTAFAQTIPSGRAISLEEIINIAKDLGGFLMIVGGILAAIVIIWSGISYLLAGSDSTKVKAAKDILKAGIIGAIVIFGMGVIIATIRGIAENPFQFFG